MRYEPDTSILQIRAIAIDQRPGVEMRIGDSVLLVLSPDDAMGVAVGLTQAAWIAVEQCEGAASAADDAIAKAKADGKPQGGA